MTTLDFVSKWVGIDPAVADNVDPDKAFKLVSTSSGAPDMARSKEEREKIRAARIQAQQQQQQMAAMAQMAHAYAAMAQAFAIRMGAERDD